MRKIHYGTLVFFLAFTFLSLVRAVAIDSGVLLWLILFLLSAVSFLSWVGFVGSHKIMDSEVFRIMYEDDYDW